MQKIIVIVGPTGIGKTSFAIEVARSVGAEIVNADSVQLYKRLDIGSAKPDRAELAQARHHLIDFLDPELEFDAGQFMTLADQAIADIAGRGKQVVVAGGTGFYVKALLHGLFRSRRVCEKTIRALEAEARTLGAGCLHERLSACDPRAADRIHPNDTFRVVRALEVFQTTGQTISSRQQDHGFGSDRYDALQIGLTMDRDALYRRINQRVDIMLEQGLLDEVKALVKDGYSLNLKSLQTIGYRQMGLFLENRVDWKEAVRLLKRDTRRYAKRQMTWFKKDPAIHWFARDRLDPAMDLINNFLT